MTSATGTIRAEQERAAALAHAAHALEERDTAIATLAAERAANAALLEELRRLQAKWAR